MRHCPRSKTFKPFFERRQSHDSQQMRHVETPKNFNTVIKWQYLQIEDCHARMRSSHDLIPKLTTLPKNLYYTNTHGTPAKGCLDELIQPSENCSMQEGLVSLMFFIQENSLPLKPLVISHIFCLFSLAVVCIV